MKIAIAGGHSKAAPGAAHFINEYVEDRKVAAALITELNNRGVSTVACSNEKTTQGSELAEECRLANNSGADLFIAIHFNAASVTEGQRGTEVWYYNGSNAGRNYAANVSAKLASKLGLPNRGPKATRGLYVLRHTNMTAILIEVCFVDAHADTNAYQSLGYQAVAAAIADALCGTDRGTTGSTSVEVSAPSQPAASSSSTSSSRSSVAAVQRWCNDNYNYSQAVDGINGRNTKRGLVMALQTELNRQFGAGLVVDGYWGPKTRAACVNVRRGARGNITKVLQGALICLCYNTGGFDGIYGGSTKNAVIAFQKSHGLSPDGIAGKNTFAKLLG